MSVSRALITGASSGIGEVYARRLAARGADLVLVARRADRLEALAGELEQQGVSVEVLDADLTDDDELVTVADRVAAVEAPVDLLVNNAGFGVTGVFAELPVARQMAMVELNVGALVRLTHAALGAMVGRGAGAIVNVSSLAAFQPMAHTATYAATKAFVLSFTEAVAEEARGSGVSLQVLCPGLTRTEFHTANDFDVAWIPQLAWQSAEQVVDASLAALGGRRVVVVPGLVNRAVATASSLGPGRVVRWVASTLARR